MVVGSGGGGAAAAAVVTVSRCRTRWWWWLLIAMVVEKEKRASPLPQSVRLSELPTDSDWFSIFSTLFVLPVPLLLSTFPSLSFLPLFLAFVPRSLFSSSLLLSTFPPPPSPPSFLLTLVSHPPFFTYRSSLTAKVILESRGGKHGRSSVTVR